MERFKVGDKVRVVFDSKIKSIGGDGECYLLDDGEWYWKESLEPIELAKEANPDNVNHPVHCEDGGMDSETFNRILKEVLDKCQLTLGSKSQEYATEDKLHNFHSAAILEQITPMQALGGMMSKHTISVYDMIATGKSYPKEKWEEKIYDHINYLILLRALVEEACE